MLCKHIWPLTVVIDQLENQAESYKKWLVLYLFDMFVKIKMY